MTAVDSRRLDGNTDAVAWTEEFQKICPDADAGTLLAWFANAIETGRAAGARPARIPDDAPDETCSLTHHTFLVGPWAKARTGAVHVRQLDDPDDVVLILQPGDVYPFMAALACAAAGTPVKVDNHDLDHGR